MPNPENLIKGTWKPGESGNPSGKPKGTLNRSTIARKWLEMGESFMNPITGERELLSQEDIITLAQMKEARKGNTNAYKALMDSAHGAPTQDIKHVITESQKFKIGDQEISFE